MPQSHLEDLFKYDRSTKRPRTCISNKFAGGDSGLATTLQETLYQMPGIENNFDSNVGQPSSIAKHQGLQKTHSRMG